MKWLVFVVFMLSPPLAQGEQGSSCRPLTSLVLSQRSYAQVDIPAFEQRVYLYAPDIKSGWGGGFSAFQLWIVEGIYGKPFVQPTGSLDESAFEQIRTSRNVTAIPVPMERDARQKRAPFTIGKQRYVIELEVNTSLGGADRVSVKICQ